MLTHSRIAELTLQLSGRLTRLGQNPRAQRTGTSVGFGAFQSAIRATALCSAPIRTTSPTDDPMARRRPLSTILHTVAVFAVAAALSGAAVDAAAARGGGFGGEALVAEAVTSVGLGVISSLDRAADLGGAISAALEAAMSAGLGVVMSAGLGVAISAGLGGAMSAGSGGAMSAGSGGAMSAGSGAALAATSAVFLEADSITTPWQLILVALQALLLSSASTPPQQGLD